MENPVVVIEISGGNLVSVYSDKPIKYVLIDWDNIKEGDSLPQDADSCDLYDPDVIDNLNNVIELLNEK